MEHSQIQNLHLESERAYLCGNYGIAIELLSQAISQLYVNSPGGSPHEDEKMQLMVKRFKPPSNFERLQACYQILEQLMFA